jgi:cytochrome P450
MIKESRESGKELDFTQTRDEVLTFLFAGHDTTASTLSMALYLLTENPKIVEDLIAEMESVVGDKSPEYADLDQLKLLDRVWKETLRIYPPAMFLGMCEQ